MEAIFHDWISLFVRWAHIIAGISWIGSSFYFMWLDSSLKGGRHLPEGVKGENWTVHGGGFYNTMKYQVAPEGLPDELHWFKWESYMTWLTGFMMLSVTYYWGAESFLIDRDVADLSVWQAIIISTGSLVVGWVFYDQLCKSKLRSRPVALFGVLFVVVVALTWAYGEVFSSRAAWLHVGALVATMMTGNVFFQIIPNTKIVVEDLRAGREPAAKYGEIAKLRSTHNNYLTLPVVLMMVSNHYPMTYGHPYSWVLVGMILIAGAVVRMWFNAHESGETGLATHWQWPVTILICISMMWFSSWRPDQVEVEVDTGAALALMVGHCSQCHAAVPTHEGFDEAPGGLKFDSIEAIRASADKILAQTVLSKTMPLGNETEMTPQDRAVLGAWLRAGAPDG